MSKRTLTISRIVVMLILFSMQGLFINAQSTPTGKDMGASPCYSCPKTTVQTVSNNNNSNSNTIQQPSAAQLAQQQRHDESLTANKKGVDFYNKGDWANAIIVFQEAVDKNPGNQTMKDNLEKAKQQLFLQQQQLQQQQQNAAAVLKMQQSIQAYTQTLNTAPSNNGLNFNGQNANNSSGNNNSASGLTFIPATSTPVTTTNTTALPLTYPNVVDARNVPTGLPKSVEASIPNTPAGDRVRKGFQAITAHDWDVALAWFQDALNHEPGEPGLQRLVDLAQYTLQKQSAAMKKQTAIPKTVPVPTKIDNTPKETNEDLARSLKEYEATHKSFPLPQKGVPTPTVLTPNWGAFFDALFKKPPKSKYAAVAAVRD